MNKFNEMIDHMQMPKEQYEQLKADLMQQTEAKRNTRTVWQRYAVAAALAICLLGTTVTAYAAVRYQWFQLFFDNGNQEAELTEEFLAKASTETVTAENDKYQYTVLNHLYSEEQQMGLILCSFHFLKEDNTHLTVLDREYNTVVLKKNRVVDGETFQLENAKGADRDLSFRVKSENGKEMVSATMMYFTGEMAEDGGYLIGIRYNFAVEKKMQQIPQLVMALENAGDIEKKLRVSLPQSGDVACTRFVSEKKAENVIVISPLGMTLTIAIDKKKDYQNMLDYEIFEDLKLVMADQSKPVNDSWKGYSTSILTGDSQTEQTWYIQKEFTNLVDVSQIDYIELDGEKYCR